MTVLGVLRPSNTVKSHNLKTNSGKKGTWKKKMYQDIRSCSNEEVTSWAQISPGIPLIITYLSIRNMYFSMKRQPTEKFNNWIDCEWNRKIDLLPKNFVCRFYTFLPFVVFFKLQFKIDGWLQNFKILDLNFHWKFSKINCMILYLINERHGGKNSIFLLKNL